MPASTSILRETVTRPAGLRAPAAPAARLLVLVVRPAPPVWQSWAHPRARATFALGLVALRPGDLAADEPLLGILAPESVHLLRLSPALLANLGDVPFLRGKVGRRETRASRSRGFSRCSRRRGETPRAREIAAKRVSEDARTHLGLLSRLLLAVALLVFGLLLLIGRLREAADPERLAGDAADGQQR